jgi:DNA-binding transcriptional MocR family regulator
MALWIPSIRKSDGPLYRGIADAIADAIESGELANGARLPPQRSMAGALGVDYTTVSRAYAEAGKRGLVEGRVGQGTFVVRRPPGKPAIPGTGGEVDLSMNVPPAIDDPALAARMWRAVGELGQAAAGGLDLLRRYQPPGGAGADRLAGMRWLSRRLPSLTVERVLVCPGAQGAMLAAMGTLADPGDTILSEALCYPGFRALAAQLRLFVRPVAMDAEGIVPEDFDAACRRERPKVLYCTPTLHNPTTATMSRVRREAVVAVARHHGVPILEDDAYAALLAEPLPPLAALAPDLTYYVAGLAKTLAPALRIAYLATPDARIAARVMGGIRATATMASPLTAALATTWIEDGTADAVLRAIRAETRARQAIAASILPPEMARTHPDAFHVWLSLSEPWTREEFASRMRATGIATVTSDAFAVARPPEAVRLALGAAVSRSSIDEGLRIIADLLQQSPAISSMVV